MRTTVTLDDDLLAEAHELSGIEERPALLKAALKALIHMEASRRLAALGGSDPNAKLPPRRRPPTYLNEDNEWGAMGTARTPPSIRRTAPRPREALPRRQRRLDRPHRAA